MSNYYWFLVQKEFLTERLVERSYKDRKGKSPTREDLVKYGESLAFYKDVSEGDVVEYVVLPLLTYFHNDLQGLIAYSKIEISEIFKQDNWEHNKDIPK